MKAMFLALAEFVNVALFLLATNAARLLLLAATLCAWWYLSDYYFAPWPWWMDQFAFMACSLVIFLGLTAAVQHFCVNLPAQRHKPRFDLLSASSGTLQLSRANWCEVLGAIADFGRGFFWRRYWTWYRLRIEHLGEQRDESVESLRTCWWFHLSALPQWLALACLPALWVALWLTPLHTNMMERVAAFDDFQPQVIYDVRCSGTTSNVSGKALPTRLGGSQPPRGSGVRPVDLTHDSLGFERMGSCWDLDRGKFEIFSSPFPRVYRSFVAKCTLRCVLIPNGEVLPVLELPVPAVAGTATFEWQADPDRSLGMTVSLLRQDGSTINEVQIDP